MKAAVLHAASGVPQTEERPDPPLAAGEVHARILAAGLHPLVRVRANGTHYTSSRVYPQVPGVDAVAELPDGRVVYLGGLPPPQGTFAERVAVSPMRVLPLPAGLEPTVAAAIVNPASSGWLALKVRARMERGERVLVLGATGASGQLAVQVAREFGAGRIVAAGRNAEVLGRLGADATLQVDAGDFGAALHRELEAHGVDIVVDYLWGAPAHQTLEALLAARGTLNRRVRYVNVGQSAGGELALSPHVLRSLDLELSGSGIGAVSFPAMVAEIPQVLAAAARGALTIDVDAVPLARVAEAWAGGGAAGGRRVVLVP